MEVVDSLPPCEYEATPGPSLVQVPALLPTASPALVPQTRPDLGALTSLMAAMQETLQKIRDRKDRAEARTIANESHLGG